MVTDFKETLEIAKSSSCFLSYSWAWSKEDLAGSEDEYGLADPPMEIAFGENATLAEVVDKIDNFLPTADKCAAAIRCLLDTGKVHLEEEY